MTEREKPSIGPRVPYPLGYAEATTSSQTVAAPLLAGASLALVGVIIVDDGHLRWPGVTLLLVVAASIALIASIQVGGNARKYLYNNATIDAWYAPEQQKRSRALTQRNRHFNTWTKLTRRAVVAFNTGTMLLILAVATALLPRDNHAVARWIAAGLALASVLVELWWIHHLFHEELDEPQEKPNSPDGGTD